MIKIIRTYWQEHPLAIIILTATFFRLLAVIFSKGFAMSDDHFQVIQIAQSWLEGQNTWFNEDQPVHRACYIQDYIISSSIYLRL